MLVNFLSILCYDKINDLGFNKKQKVKNSGSSYICNRNFITKHSL
jgi:hypothetical protein